MTIKKIKSNFKVKNYPDVYIKVKHHKKNLTKITGVLLNKMDRQNKQIEIENLVNTSTSEIALMREINQNFKIYLEKIKPIFQVKYASELLKYLYKSTGEDSEKHIYEFLVSLLKLIKMSKSSLEWFGSEQVKYYKIKSEKLKQINLNRVMIVQRIKSNFKVKNYADVYIRVKHHKKTITEITGVLLNQTLDIKNKQIEIDNVVNKSTSETALMREINQKFKVYLKKIKPIFQVKDASGLLNFLYISTVKDSEKHIYEFLVPLLKLINMTESSLEYFLISTIANHLENSTLDDSKLKTDIKKVTLLASLEKRSGPYFLNIIDLAQGIKLKYESCGSLSKTNLKYNKICKLLDNPIIIGANTIVESQEYRIQMLNFFEATLQKMEMFVEEKIDISTSKNKYTYKSKEVSAYVYKLTKTLTSLFSHLPNKNVTFPRVVKPLDWILQDSVELGNDLACGGFFLNKNKYSSTQNSREIKIFFQSYHAENINYVQKQKYVVDSKVLNHVVDNFDECLYQYLLMMDLGSMTEEVLGLFMQKNLEGFCYFSPEEFEINFNAKLKINPDFSMGLSSLDIFNKLSHQIVKYYQIVELAKLLSKFKLEIYFLWTYDFRMRMSPSRGSILSPHGGDLARSLLNPSNEEQVFHSFSDSSDKAVKDLKKEKKTKNNYFSLLKNTLNGGVKTVYLDSAASDIQLLGACLGNLNVLKLTNYLKTADTKSKKMDFYKQLTELFLKELKAAESKKHFRVTKGIFNSVKKIVDRSFIKKWTIAYLYGQGRSERTDSLTKQVKSIRHTFPKEMDNREVSNLCFKIANLFTKAIGIIFPEIIEYLDFIKKNIKKGLKRNNKITLSCGKLHSVIDVTYFEYTPYDKPLMKPGVRRRGTAVAVSSETLNFKKSYISSLSNLASNRHAEIMQYVISECRKAKICVVPTHDGMVVDVGQADFVKEMYFEGVYAILINFDCFAFFLKSNNLKLSDPWSDDREKIIDEVYNGSLQKNYYILN